MPEIDTFPAICQGEIGHRQEESAVPEVEDEGS